MKTNWTILKLIRYYIFCLTTFIHEGIGFALPEERKEFYQERDKNIPECS